MSNPGGRQDRSGSRRVCKGPEVAVCRQLTRGEGVEGGRRQGRQGSQDQLTQGSLAT